MTDAHRAYARIKLLGLCAVVVIVAVFIIAVWALS